MREIDKIRERHSKEIEGFQAVCPHEAVSDWRPFMWAPGHYSHEVKVCERCGQTVEEKSYTAQFMEEEKL